MKDVKKRRVCLQPGCVKRASFNFFDCKRPACCARHMLPGMVNVSKRKAEAGTASPGRPEDTAATVVLPEHSALGLWEGMQRVSLQIPAMELWMRSPGGYLEEAATLSSLSSTSSPPLMEVDNYSWENQLPYSASSPSSSSTSSLPSTETEDDAWEQALAYIAEDVESPGCGAFVEDPSFICTSALDLHCVEQVAVH